MNTRSRRDRTPPRNPADSDIGGWPAIDIRALRHRDRMWCGVTVVKVIRSVTTPGVEEVRTWLAAWAAAHPLDNRVRLLDPERGRTGRPAPGCEVTFLHALVTGSEADAPPDDALDPSAAEPDGLPFRLTLGRDWARVRHSHTLGDGTATWDFIGMLLAAAADRPTRATPAGTDPLRRALLTTFGRPPSRLPDAITLQRTLTHMRNSHTGNRDGGAVGPHTFAVATATSAESFGERVRVFRAAHDSAASVMSIMTMRALLLCRHHGIDVDDTVAFMVDLRRYLPAAASADSNFSWSKSVPVLDSDTPTQLSARIGAILDSGLPLLAFGSAMWRSAIARSARPAVSRQPEHAVRLLISYATRWQTSPPPSGPAAPRITAAIAPPGPNFLGFNVVEARGRIHVSVNWCPATLDRALAERIAADFVVDPGLGAVDAALWKRGSAAPPQAADPPAR
ncbi:hypothetical protein [Nocardia sp. alder85J]|uniref:hypothetical protein n=1 Tax=Nocardia sp. alder85J TaxID=2862949 RepID=UPI001CD1C7D7|nr:hypothetical protein [Nocardia sp. alder85J]MCX4093223.1 hypothetical protein [Nocardia sp. alder85J]